MKAIQIWWLKRKARAAFLRYGSAVDRLGCGNEIATHVSRDVRESRATFNICMDRLAALGESVPEKRL